MQRSFAFARAVAVAAVVAVLGAFAVVQLASDALNAGAAAPNALPSRIPYGFGMAVYRALDRVAPAPFVEATLAARALASGDAAAAERYALKLPASPERDELLARAARLSGDDRLALEYFLAAPDVDEVQAVAEDLARRDPEAAYDLERVLRVRLAMLTTHPDAVAEAYWNMGQYANRTAWPKVSGSPEQNAWLQRADRDFESAVSLAPFSEKYLIAAANQAFLVRDYARAGALFGRAVDVDPGSANAIAGLGAVALAHGDRSSARAFLARARAIDPGALMVRSLGRALAGQRSDLAP